MTTSRRRLPLVAVCIASASLLATQPALAGSNGLQEKIREQPAPPANPMTSITEMLKRITQMLKDLQDQSAGVMTTMQKG